MKITRYVSLFFLLIQVGVFAQTDEITVENDQISVKLRTDGWIAYNGEYSGGHFVSKENEDIISLYAASLWLVLEDDENDFWDAAGNYFDLDLAEISFIPGILDQGIGLAELENYNRFFPITREEIDAHIADWQDNQQIDQMPSENLLGWPAKSNPNFGFIHGFNFPDNYAVEDLAPFHDENEDGIYNVYDGDYPLVKGDKVWWYSFIDQKAPELGFSEIGAEIHCLAYLYETGNSTIDQSLFLDYKILNRGYRLRWPRLSMGFFADPDIGSCADKNYIGSIPESDVTYAYSSDPLVCYPEDQLSADAPVFSAIAMKEGGLSSLSYFNSSFPSPFGISHKVDYLWHVQALSVTLGGNGDDGDTPHPYVFDGTLIDGEPWTECSANNPPGDRRMVLGLGNGTVSQGESITERIALNVKFGVNNPCLQDNRNVIAQNADIIKYFDSKYEQFILNEEKAPIALFDFESQGNYQVKFEDNSILNPESWLWEFEDLGTSEERNPVFVFPESGVYNVCLTTTNAQGESKLCQTLYMNDEFKPIADFTFTVRDGKIVSFNETSENDPTAFLWELGDGKILQSRTFIHRYTTMENEVEVCLTAINDFGRDKICKTINLITSNDEWATEQEKLQVFPNPSKNGVFHLSNTHCQNCGWVVRNIFGQELLSVESFESTIDLENYPSGVYYLDLKSEEIRLESAVLIKN